MTHPLRALLRRLGFKDRIFSHCARGNHVWRQTYGDERLHYRKWHCVNCPLAQDADPS